jgi:FkbM family methyltransferase
MLRAARGRDLWRGVQLHLRTVSLGKEGASWVISPHSLTEESVVYSFGVGEDISFDLQLIQRFGLRVHAFDPTPRSIEWIRSQTLPKEFNFHPYGISDFDGTCKFSPPENPLHVSHTILDRQTPWRTIEAPVHRLCTIMSVLGHDRLHLLKMDIEGAEYGVLADMLKSRIAVDQLLVEFHHRWPEVGIAKTKRAIDALGLHGFRIFYVSPNGEEYSFKCPVESPK